MSQNGQTTRIETVHSRMRRLLAEAPVNEELKLLFAAHMHAVSNMASMIALKRGFDPELAAIAGAMHDIASFKTGNFELHGERGAVMARELLWELAVTSKDETDQICQAIYNHNYKERVDSPFDEILKDADVWQHCFYDSAMPPAPKEALRFQNLLKEFEIFNLR